MEEKSANSETAETRTEKTCTNNKIYEREDSKSEYFHLQKLKEA